MQIFPISSDMLYKEASSLSRGNGRDSFAFNQLFTKFFKNTPAEITPNLFYDSVDKNTSFFSTEAPYDNSAELRVDVSTLYPSSSSIDDIRFTDSELQKVIDSLAAQGAATETVQNLLGSPNGTAIGDVIQAVAYEAPVRLSESDMINIRSLANKLDSSGQLGERVLSDFRQGRSVQAWDRLSKALSSYDPNVKLSISHKEIVSLGKALGANSATLDALSKSFKGSKELSLTPDQLRNLLVPLQQQMTNKIDAQSKLASQLEGALMPVIKEAKKRMDEEISAGTIESRRSEQSKILIQDTVTKNGIANIQQQDVASETLNKIQGAEQTQDTVTKNGIANTQQQDVASETLNKIQGARQNTDSAKFAGQFQPQTGDKENLFQGKNSGDGLFEKNNGQDSKGLLSDNKGKGVTTTSSNPWESLAQRLGVNQSVGTVIPLQQPIQQNAQLTAIDRLAARMFSQIEQGAFSALRNGTSKLELTLNPLELGTVNVLLTTKNGEVSALLRPERAETTAALLQQMDSLRAELEQQGLKVAKVEVQTQLKDEQNMHWQGMDQHNSSQEQSERVRDLERLRMLGRVGQEDNGVEISLAHNMHNNSMTAGNTSRVDIIA
ncbi:flagellar hook-length control protein FliK [Lawsonia intracellularis]|uniref:Flagellar hook-length control protein n=1 Tax=Lawsonia intracellularis (strain PHE/MN1-00) TaxID=363253 RepID=Q1MQV5_LAWIP|nr:flagellar hook-length control protein FliK [Lawsonia intracellularis]AGC49985.1 flagellar hook-length control protein [Lawsonia intracellularis N343]KAA0204683.1 flagellar hook-length control protein FliK [Lawsonia intracellularis]MBZ3893048.1 flagellar hook-length control protein FliK [Lawsonia intracellularis]RBN33404.1 flagellar hook-length control protein FliK [Lawsonia intracellularis]RBN34772.1 flagellar hook-length control protein FliK [Lawsonia intracellularis]